MRARLITWIAQSLWAFILGLVGLSMLLLSGNRADVQAFSDALSQLTFGIVGALILARRPENLIGWVLGGGSLLWALGTTAQQYAVYTLTTRPGSLPSGIWAAWLASWVPDVAAPSMLIHVFLLFPTGRLLSPRWRLLAWLAAGLLTYFTIIGALTPGPLQRMPAITNPLGLEAVRTLRALEPWAGVLMIGTITACPVSVLLRFRRATGIERQQLKWVAYVIAILIVQDGLRRVAGVSGVLQDSALRSVGFVLSTLIFTAFPAAIGIAILRYRLFDIDIIINRTLVYGALTATLALVYVGSVVLFQQLFRPLLGESNNLAIVASTLAIAALFQPLRRRIQATIDRRFYRRKYDVTKTLADFSVRLRDEVDLKVLTSDLMAVVEETLQPAHVSLWVRDTGARRQEREAGKW